MKKLNLIDKMIGFQVGILILTVILCAMKFVTIPLILLIISSIFLIIITRKLTGNYVNIPFLFVCFHILYGLSGVISVTWGNGLSSTYGYEFYTPPYMIAYSLCTIALTLGMNLCFRKCKKNTLKTINNEGLEKYFAFVAICGFCLTFVCEIINFFRVGGFDTIILGKAVYQALVDELTFTLPTQLISQVSLASLGIYVIMSNINKTKLSKKLLTMCGLFLIPYLGLLLFLGRRGPLLAYLLIIVLSISQFKPLKKLTMKFIVILSIIYIVFGLMFGIRNYMGLALTDFKEFTSKAFNKRTIISSLNPGTNEFGCTFGNFNKLYISDDYDFLYGKSYLEGLVHFVPAYLYPGDKPQMITYSFRDKYFPFKAEISSVAGTAFSSILESYWNFGYFGAIIYVGYGYLVLLLDRKLKNKNYFMLLTYISISPFVYSFHRSELGHVLSQVILILLMISFIYIFYKKVYTSNTIISKVFHKNKSM